MNFRIAHINGVTSLGYKKIKFNKIYTKASSNKIRNVNGGEDGELKANLNSSFSSLGIVKEAEKIIVEKMPDGRYRVVDGNHRFRRIDESMLDNGMLEVEVVKFANGKLGDLARGLLQAGTNLPLPNKPMTKAQLATHIYSMSKRGLVNLLDDDEVKEIIEQMASWMSDTWKYNVRKEAQTMNGVPVEFVSYDKKESKKLLAQHGIGTEFAYNDKINMHEAVLKSGTEWRGMGHAIRKFMESECKIKTKVVVGLEKSPAGGDFDAARKGVEETCRKQIETWRQFFCEYGLTAASMDDFMEFSGKALPQDGINEKEESDNNELVDY